MPRSSLSGHPFLLGFEQVDRMLERAAKSGSDGYPPYNIEMRGRDAYRITLAVAGFEAKDLDVTIEDGNLLVIRGRAAQDRDDAAFLHRGIASRQFQKSFVLAEGVDVTTARLRNGLLDIDLERAAAETEVQRIDIRDV